MQKRFYFHSLWIASSSYFYDIFPTSENLFAMQKNSRQTLVLLSIIAFYFSFRLPTTVRCGVPERFRFQISLSFRKSNAIQKRSEFDRRAIVLLVEIIKRIPIECKEELLKTARIEKRLNGGNESNGCETIMLLVCSRRNTNKTGKQTHVLSEIR